MRRCKKLIFIMIIVMMICLLCGAKGTVTKTCLRSGCNRKCSVGRSYCIIHDFRPKTKKDSGKQTKKKNYSTATKKKSGSSKHSKKTRKTIYPDDEMPDYDDYDCWGDFMDDWDGFMPDGSDASDYWDNW